MKKIQLLAISSLFLINNVYANDADSAPDACTFFKETAADAMNSRQNGEPIEKALLSADMLKLKSEEVRTTDPLASSLINQAAIFEKVSVEMAYKKPLYTTEAEKQKAIMDHQDMIYKLCEMMGKANK